MSLSSQRPGAQRDGPAGAWSGRRGDRDERPGDRSGRTLRQTAAAARGRPSDAGRMGVRITAAVGAAAGRSTSTEAVVVELKSTDWSTLWMRLRPVIEGDPANLPSPPQSSGARVDVPHARASLLHGRRHAPLTQRTAAAAVFLGLALAGGARADLVAGAAQCGGVWLGDRRHVVIVECPVPGDHYRSPQPQDTA